MRAAGGRRRDAESAERGRAGAAVARPKPLLAVLGGLLVLNLSALPYYVLPFAGRLRSPLHEWFRPSGYIGQSAGILAFAMFLFLWIYPLRKRVRWLRGLGRLPRWLDVHIVVGLAVPIVGGMHAAWRFEGLIGLGYMAMLTVCVSGIVGKYLYLRIPRSRAGVELSLKEIDACREELLDHICLATGLDRSRVAADVGRAGGSRARSGLVRGLRDLVIGDLTRHLRTRALLREWKADGSRRELRDLFRLVRREIRLVQQVNRLDVTQRLFGFWHIAHLPIAITALVAVLVHVVVVIALGVTWF